MSNATKTFEFNSRETYLAYRAEWKKNYRELSQTIRQAKKDAKESGRAFDIEGMATAQYNMWKYARQATAMLEELAEAKIEANRQYNEQKAKESEAA